MGSEGVGHCATVFATAPPYPTPLPPLVSLVADHKSDQLVSLVQFHTAGLLPGRLIERARVSQVFSLSLSLSLCVVSPRQNFFQIISNLLEEENKDKWEDAQKVMHVILIHSGKM